LGLGLFGEQVSDHGVDFGEETAEVCLGDFNFKLEQFAAVLCGCVRSFADWACSAFDSTSAKASAGVLKF